MILVQKDKTINIPLLLVGVEDAFSFTSKVMSVSFHKYSPGFFPGKYLCFLPCFQFPGTLFCLTSLLLYSVGGQPKHLRLKISHQRPLGAADMFSLINYTLKWE